MQSQRHDRYSHGTGTTAMNPSASHRARGGASPSSRGSPLRSRNPRLRSEDSWIEVSSQPSTSSLSSIATTDDIITTGLRVERSNLHTAALQRIKRKRSQQQQQEPPQDSMLNDSSQESSLAGGSSQDEYDETDSESDKVMSGSNEDITAQSRGDALLLRRASRSETASLSTSSDNDGDDDDDNDDGDRSTSLGTRTTRPEISSSPFVPQPNAFSHAPQYSRSRSYNGPGATPSIVSNSSRATTVRHHSSSTVRDTRSSSRTQHAPYNMISPSYQADHDAALRASLSTLLSLGTAVRGAPKNNSPPTPAGASIVPASSFRLVSELVVMGEETDDAGRIPRSDPASPHVDSRQQQQQAQTQMQQPQSPPRSHSSKGKRKASKDRGPSHTSSTSKKTRSINNNNSATTSNSNSNNNASGITSSALVGVSPTLMTWVISAGVVVLFSAISFSAGYALGREVGRTEMGMSSTLGGGGGISDHFADVRSSTGCGRDAVKGSLKRLRWSGSAGGVSVYN